MYYRLHIHLRALAQFKFKEVSFLVQGTLSQYVRGKNWKDRAPLHSTLTYFFLVIKSNKITFCFFFKVGLLYNLFIYIYPTVPIKTNRLLINICSVRELHAKLLIVLFPVFVIDWLFVLNCFPLTSSLYAPELSLLMQSHRLYFGCYHTLFSTLQNS